ncbi:hypothetical protein RRG08_011879 [Elysia crispata]|uniref:Uncharacterized protein n=1 Tax=Elysia crispata TaxID=231223 RepID=A0AAE0ZN78_9GAST|nr:hypothetical protein RRG08_011879 [Elysia crispata]
MQKPFSVEQTLRNNPLDVQCLMTGNGFSSAPITNAMELVFMDRRTEEKVFSLNPLTSIVSLYLNLSARVSYESAAWIYASRSWENIGFCVERNNCNAFLV